MTKRYKSLFEILVSLLIALVFFVITYWAMNSHIPISAEKVKLQLFEKFRQAYWPKAESTMTDSVIMIDTHYDQQFVMEHDVNNSNLPIGLVPVTDRQKLLKCLACLKEKSDYKYILLDIFLDKAVGQESDSLLHRTIASMKNIVIAKPQTLPLADTCLKTKVGTVQYSLALWENDFVKFPFFYEGERSLPLIMYENVTGNTISKEGWFYFDQGLARNSVILTYDNVDIDERAYLGGVEDYTIEDALRDTRGKYVLIGDFVDDMHNTFLGEVPGTLINYYAYLALLNGHHKLSVWVILFFIVVFAIPIYLKITDYRFPKWLIEQIRVSTIVCRLESFSVRLSSLIIIALKKALHNHAFTIISRLYKLILKLLSKLFSSWVGYPLYLTVVCFYTYLVFNEAYDILVTTALYYVLNVICDSYNEKKSK